MKWLITFWCLCSICTGKGPHDRGYGVTKSGKLATVGITVACDPSLLGKRVRIAGIGRRVCEDIGGMVKGNHVDVLVRDHEEALRLGRQERQVEVLR